MSIKSFLPRTRWGDHVVHFVKFVKAHHRLPSKRMLINDALYRLKVSAEIEDPLRVLVSDKEYVKLYVAAKVGDVYNVPTLAVLRSMQEVRTYAFPEVCCIKPTHLSGKVLLRHRGEPLDFAEIAHWFSLNRYHATRERNYRTLQPKVIVEPLLFGGSAVLDYKFFCYRGKARLIQIDFDRANGHTRKYFDRNWSEQDYSMGYPRNKALFEKPLALEKMTRLADTLSEDFGFIRVDLYAEGDTVLVGEITNCHGNAHKRFIPVSAEAIASRLLFD